MATVETIFGKHHHRYTQLQLDMGNLLQKLGDYKAGRQLYVCVIEMYYYSRLSFYTCVQSLDGTSLLCVGSTQR